MDDLSAGLTIVGAGGIGCAVGHALRCGGVDVTFVDTDSAKLDWGRRNGVAVGADTPLEATFLHFDDWKPAGRGLVLLCTKCYDNRAVLARIPAAVELVPIQNGFDGELLDRVEIEGIASFVSECIPGRSHTRITRPGDLHLGYRRAQEGRQLPGAVTEMIRAFERHGGFSVRRVDEVLPFKYTKLMYNAAISPLAAMAGLDNGQLLTVARARRLFFALLRENYGILRRADAPLGRVGPLHPDQVDRILRLPLVARLLARPFARSLRGTYCSMAGDLPRGTTEVANYNGHLLSLAEDGTAPLNRAVVTLVERMERERPVPHLRWLDVLSQSLQAS